jgi:hypothetical protein
MPCVLGSTISGVGMGTNCVPSARGIGGSCTRVATAENESQLLTIAHGATAAQVERVVRAWRKIDAQAEVSRRWSWGRAFPRKQPGGSRVGPPPEVLGGGGREIPNVPPPEKLPTDPVHDLFGKNALTLEGWEGKPKSGCTPVREQAIDDDWNDARGAT